MKNIILITIILCIATLSSGQVKFTIAGYEIGVLDNKSFQLKSPGQCVFIGESAGANDDGSTNSNTYVGYQSGMNSTSGGGNTFLGHMTGLENF